MGQQLRMPFAPPEEGFGVAAWNYRSKKPDFLASTGTHHEHAYIHTYKLFVLFWGRVSLCVSPAFGFHFFPLRFFSLVCLFCLHACRVRGHEGLGFPRRGVKWLWAAVWMLRIEAKSPATATSALHCWAIFQACWILGCVLQQLTCIILKKFWVDGFTLETD